MIANQDTIITELLRDFSDSTLTTSLITLLITITHRWLIVEGETIKIKWFTAGRTKLDQARLEVMVQVMKSWHKLRKPHLIDICGEKSYNFYFNINYFNFLLISLFLVLKNVNNIFFYVYFWIWVPLKQVDLEDTKHESKKWEKSPRAELTRNVRAELVNSLQVIRAHRSWYHRLCRQKYTFHGFTEWGSSLNEHISVTAITK